MPIAEVVRRLDLVRKTVRRCVRDTAWQPYQRPARPETLLTPHAEYLRERAEQVDYLAQILFQELRQGGGRKLPLPIGRRDPGQPTEADDQRIAGDVAEMLQPAGAHVEQRQSSTIVTRYAQTHQAGLLCVGSDMGMSSLRNNAQEAVLFQGILGLFPARLFSNWG